MTDSGHQNNNKSSYIHRSAKAFPSRLQITSALHAPRKRRLKDVQFCGCGHLHIYSRIYKIEYRTRLLSAAIQSATYLVYLNVRWQGVPRPVSDHMEGTWNTFCRYVNKCVSTIAELDIFEPALVRCMQSWRGLELGKEGFPDLSVYELFLSFWCPESVIKVWPNLLVTPCIRCLRHSLYKYFYRYIYKY